MRSAAIALKLAQAAVIYDRTKERPVVFLDDIFSELDHGRSLALQQQLLAAHQLFIATARPEDVAGLRDRGEIRVWNVAAGRITPALAEAHGG
jgi:DNA replication and repair protein RecF